MKKYSQLQNSTKLSQIQSRLTLYPYLSKGNLPSGSDAKIFLFMEKIRKIPSKISHPNTYHWYILMKQFSERTLSLWEKKYEEDNEEDRLVSDYVQMENQLTLKKSKTQTINKDKLNFSDHAIKQSLNFAENPKTPKNTMKTKNSFAGQLRAETARLFNDQSNLRGSCNLKPGPQINCFILCPPKMELNTPVVEEEYVMEMQLKSYKPTFIRELKERLQDQVLELLSFQTDQGTSLRVVFKIERDQYEQLKDRISKWKEVSNLQFRKQKKGGNLIKSEKMLFSPRQLADPLH